MLSSQLHDLVVYGRLRLAVFVLGLIERYKLERFGKPVSWLYELQLTYLADHRRGYRPCPRCNFMFDDINTPKWALHRKCRAAIRAQAKLDATTDAIKRTDTDHSHGGYHSRELW